AECARASSKIEEPSWRAMKSSGQSRLPTGSSALSEPTEPIARTRSQPCSASGRRLAAGSISWGRTKGASGPPWRCTIAAPCSAAAAAISSPPGPSALLPRITASRPIGRRSYAEFALCLGEPNKTRTRPRPSVAYGEAMEDASSGRDATERDSGREESEGDRLDRNLGELLQELRVALPGVQVLFAFLLAVPFQQNFTKITELEKRIYFVTLLCTAISAVLLISPSAYHRLTFRYQQKRKLIFYSNRFAIAGLFFLALAMTGAIALITAVLFGTAAS